MIVVLLILYGIFSFTKGAAAALLSLLPKSAKCGRFDMDLASHTCRVVAMGDANSMPMAQGSMGSGTDPL